MLESEEDTVTADKGPVMLLRDCMSLSRLVASVCSWVKAVVWLCSVVSWFSQDCSGASAAVTAALTAEVTSMPEEDAPVAACRIWLRSMPDEEEVDASS